MSLHFLLGEAGSGKSTQIREEILREALQHPEKNYLLLVPEQFCLSTQRLLVEAHPRRALINIEALSFDRLAGRAFREFSISSDSIISDTVKQMLLALAVRDVLPDLSVYGRQALHPSFTAHLGTLFAEWEMNGIDPQSLAENAEEKKLPQLLKRKLADLTRLFAAYRKRLGERISAEERLAVFSRLLPKSGIGRVEHLYLDGFTGFTGIQYRILEQLMRRAEDTTAVLTLPAGEDADAWFDPSRRRRDELYAMSQETIWRLKRSAETLGQKHGDIRYSRRAPERAGELTFLSARFLQPAGDAWTEAPGKIRLFGADSPQAEAEWAAARIRQLTKDKDLHYRDIALLVSDPALYVPYLEKYLQEAGIPYFTDRRESLAAHPLVRLLEDAWETVSGGRERDAFLRYVKNPLSPLNREESDVLENYLLAAGIRGGKRLEDCYTKRIKRNPGEKEDAWISRTDEVLAACNLSREKALAPLAELKEVIGRGKLEARKAAQALLNLAESGTVTQKLEMLSAWLAGKGEADKAQAWQEAAGAVSEFLRSLAALFGEQKLSRGELTDMLRAGLASLSVGKLPRSSDQIVIGETERSRFGAVRHLIFLGLNADLLPKPRAGGGLLTDAERLLLASEELPAYTDERALLEERFYLHNLLSLPRESLDLSFARMDSARKARQPSSLIREMSRLFPQLREESAEDFDIHLLFGETAALRRLAGSFGNNDPAWLPLYAVLKENPEEAVRQGLRQIEAGSGYHFEAAALLKETARKLYGSHISASVTRLESFASCPYKHFLRYGLSVREREEYAWESVDHGNFFHGVMENLLRQLKEAGQKPSQISPEQRREAIETAFSAALAKAPEFTENMNAPYLLSRWKNYFDRYLQAVGRWEEEQGFEPAAFELHFGADKGTALQIPLKDGAALRLQGTIDRLDVYEENDRIWLRVVDYKTGNKKLEFGALEQGTQLQLGAYLMAALAIYGKDNPDREVLPGGLYYARLKENWLREWKEPAAREHLLQESFRLQGLTAGEVASFSPDAESSAAGKLDLGSSGLLLLGHSVCRKLQELGEEILDGKIRAYPVQTSAGSLSCSFCPYTALCDRKDEAFEGREQPKMTAEEYLQKAKEAEKDGIYG